MLVTPPVVHDVPQILGRMPSFGRGPIRDRLFGHFRQNARGRTGILYIEGGVKKSTFVDWPEQVVYSDDPDHSPFKEAGLAGINYAPGYPFDNLGTLAGWTEVTDRLIAQGKEGIYWIIHGGEEIDIDSALFTIVLEPLGFTEVPVPDEDVGEEEAGGILVGDTANFDGGTLGSWDAQPANVSAEVATHPLTGSLCMKLTSDPGVSNVHTAVWTTESEDSILTVHAYHAMPITPSTEYEFRGSFYLPEGSPMGIILILHTYDDAGNLIATATESDTSDAGAVVELVGNSTVGATEVYAALVTTTSDALPDGASSYYDDFYLGPPT